VLVFKIFELLMMMFFSSVVDVTTLVGKNDSMLL